jgi:hypothetical protein
MASWDKSARISSGLPSLTHAAGIPWRIPMEAFQPDGAIQPNSDEPQTN